MQKPDAIYLDLDGIRPEKQIIIKLDGVDHELKPVTVEDFVENIQTMQKLGTGNLDVATEKAMLVDMLAQVLPTIGAPRLSKLTMQQLHTLIDFCREHNGEKDVPKEAVKEAPNPPT